MESSKGLSTLKNILFEEEKKKYVELNKKLKEVNIKIDDSLRDRVVPDGELDQIINKMVEVMPEKLGPTITTTLKIQIKESRDEVVQALFPIIGQMIKKYVAQEIAVLSERIDHQLDTLFSVENIALRIKSIFSGVSYSELLIRKSNEPQIEQIFMIEEYSGILMASYSKKKTIDEDMIAGLLTAIKSFANDAFDEQTQNLETITYDAFTLYIQGFNKFYLAVALSGTLTAEYKNRLNETILKFVKENTAKLAQLDEDKIEKTIAKYFQKI